MAWLATPEAKLLGKCVIRLKGASLNPSNSVVIGVDGDSGADYQLPAGWPPSEVLPSGLDITDVVRVSGQASTIGQQYHTVKSLSPSGTFRVTLTCDANQPMTFSSIYLEFFHSIMR